MGMNDYHININTVTADLFTAALEGFNSEHISFYKLVAGDSGYSITDGDDGTMCQGTLRECAFWWNGMLFGIVTGQANYSEEETK